ncbi:MAG: DUF29 domain-containing protein [Pseudanabaena sp.]|jgi:hypothetical protein
MLKAIATINNQSLNNQSLLYETDFYAWTQTQVELMKHGNLNALDIANLMEEIQSLGKQQKQELRNRLGVLIGHLLKWQYQPDFRSKSWRVTIRGQRRRIKEHILENPSLKSYLHQAIAEAFPDGIDLVLKETPLEEKDLPSECPYTVEQIFDPLFPDGIE